MPVPTKNVAVTVPRYTSPEEMQAKIDAYFEDCAGEILRDLDGNPLLDKMGHPIMVGVKPPSVTGLALALGFKSTWSFSRYRGKSKAFTDVVMAARTRIEEYNVARLYDKDGQRGAEFVLKSNFGWEVPKDEKEQGPSGPLVTIVNDIPKDPPVNSADDQNKTDPAAEVTESEQNGDETSPAADSEPAG